MFIVIEGQDATGKDTQARLLADYLRDKGEKVTHYAESGTGDPDPFLSEIIRLNLSKDFSLELYTHALLYLVNRYEQWQKKAEPALARGETVITTRNWLSTLIYMGYVGGADLDKLKTLHRALLPERYFSPDKIVILTLSDAERKKRLASQGRAKDEIWKSMNSDFQKRLNSSYLRAAKDFSVPTLSAAGTIDEVFEKLKSFFQI